VAVVVASNPFAHPEFLRSSPPHAVQFSNVPLDPRLLPPRISSSDSSDDRIRMDGYLREEEEEAGERGERESDDREERENSITSSKVMN
jgi:hypothetical protein